VRAYLAVWMSAGRSPNAKGERTVWLEEVWVDRLSAMRGPGEACSAAPASDHSRDERQSGRAFLFSPDLIWYADAVNDLTNQQPRVDTRSRGGTYPALQHLRGSDRSAAMALSIDKRASENGSSLLDKELSADADAAPLRR
jgi:hypothetical protein